MKEIDFLPQWYRDKRRREGHFRIQYLGLVCLLVVMLVWTISMAHAISAANRKLAALQDGRSAGNTVGLFQQMRSEMDMLRSQEAVLAKIDQHLNISAAIAELSYISGSRIKFQRIAFSAEKFPQKSQADLPANTIRAVREAMVDKSGPYEGDIRFKITLRGIASDATQVASLIRRLEDSPWFFKVIPAYCRNGTISQYTVSEFEITCYVANYSEERKTIAKENQAGQEGIRQ